MKTSTALLSLLLLVPACDHDADAPLPEDRAAIDAIEGPAGPEGALDPAAPRRDAHAEASAKAARHADEPRPVMPGAKAAFEELTALVEAKYVDGPLSEDELWTGAMEGVLARLVQHPEHQVNALLSPREHQELLIGTQGHLVGVGVMIERVANVVVVREVIAGGPAAEAGLRGGDRILGVDGERLDGLDLATVVDRIRGPEGTTVELFVQRDTEEWNEKVVRGLVTVASVQGTMLQGQVGYLRVTSFSSTTTAEIDTELAALAEQGATSLVLDLRHCPGGLLEAALETISRFVPAGATTLTVEHREGEPEVHRTEGEYPWQTRPLAVLVGPKTASSAEILADAIRESDRGLLIGQPTFGKHTVESIHELGGEWAVKLSVGRFATASGEKRLGVGVRPDIQIPAVEDGPPKLAPLTELDPSSDPVLGTALGLLRAD